MPSARPPILVLVGFAVFVLLVATLLVAPAVRPQLAQFAPSAPGPRLRSRGPDTVTVDARDPDRWQFFSLERGILRPLDTAGWDLAVRRYHLVTSGRAADLGPAGWEDTAAVPEGRWAATVFSRDTVNPVLARWYRYGWVTHLLRPRGHVYLVEAASGRRAKLEILSYYCPGAEPGCFTFRYLVLGPSRPSAGGR